MKHVVRTTLVSLAVALGAAAASPAARAAEAVTYLLPAPASLPAFGPWMVAKARGYYAEEGLDVTFQPAKGGVDVAKQVGAGNAPIGGAIGDTPILARANGVPVKAVAVLGGHSLTQLVLDTDKAKSIKDLKGKVITAMAYQDTTYFSLLGMLASQGMSKDDVDAQAVGPVNVWKLFAAGQAAAMASVPDWTYFATAQNKDLKIEIIPSDTYFKSMAQAILASDETIAKNPELVRKLVRATLKGMKAIMDDPAAAAADYVKAVPENAGREAAMTKIFEMFVKYVYADQPVLGEMDAKRLSDLQDFYLAQDIVRQKTPVEDLYTNQFVK